MQDDEYERGFRDGIEYEDRTELFRKLKTIIANLKADIRVKDQLIDKLSNDVEEVTENENY